MSDAEKKLRELIPNIKVMMDDPSLREFHPALEKMLAGCEAPELNNVDDVIETFSRNDAAYNIRAISEALCGGGKASFSHTSKKWYEE